jgi:hypothetical protein
MVSYDGTYSLVDLDNIPLVQRNAAGVKSAYENTPQAVYLLPISGELYDSERLFIGCYDNRDNQSYIAALDMHLLSVAGRVNKPKKLLLPEHYNVTSIALLNIEDKASQVCMIGRSSTSTLNTSNFKKNYDPKRVYINPLIITLL